MVLRAGARAVRRLRQALAAMAICGLLAPLLTPAMPALAAWTPDHGHVFADGVARPHSHPWDDPAAATTSVPLHFCALHPDGRVAGEMAAQPVADAVDDGEGATAEVVFLFDHDLSGSVLPPPAPPALHCAGVTLVTSMDNPARPASVVTPTPSPPPRSSLTAA
ncbi:MAG: hypothetical protein AB7I38_10785 [Dehalococcoidia bacterium]